MQRTGMNMWIYSSATFISTYSATTKQLALQHPMKVPKSWTAGMVPCLKNAKAWHLEIDNSI